MSLLPGVKDRIVLAARCSDLQDCSILVRRAYRARENGGAACVLSFPLLRVLAEIPTGHSPHPQVLGHIPASRSALPTASIHMDHIELWLICCVSRIMYVDQLMFYH